MASSFDEFDKEFDKEFEEDGDRAAHEYDNSNSGDFDDFYDEGEARPSDYDREPAGGGSADYDRTPAGGGSADYDRTPAGGGSADYDREPAGGGSADYDRKPAGGYDESTGGSGQNERSGSDYGQPSGGSDNYEEPAAQLADGADFEPEKPVQRKIGRDVRRVEFDMKMEKKDYLNLVMYSIMGKNRFAAFGVFAVLVICAGYLILGGAGVIEITGLLKLVAVALILVVVVLLLLMNYIRRKLEVSDIAYMGSQRHMIVSEDMVVSETDDEDTTREFEWEGLYNGEECKSYFLMYSNKGMIVFMPKRFMTPEQIPQIRKIMKVMMQSKFRTKYKVK